MAAVAQTIPNLLGGVSQQPDSIKLPGQVRTADNVLLDPTFGCKKRPPMQFVGSLGFDVPATGVKYIPIIRDADEHYIAVVYDGPQEPALGVCDAKTGEWVPVVFQGDARDYLQISDYQKLQAITINDFTFITNPEVPVAIDAGGWINPSKCGIATVKTAAYNTTYYLDFANDGDTSQTVVYRATDVRIAVSDRTYTKNDGGGANDQGSYEKTLSSGSKTGLKVKIIVQGQAVYRPDSNDYYTRYTVSCNLIHGGDGWQKGDTVSCEIGAIGKTFELKITDSDFEYATASAGSVSYTTPSDATSA